MRFCVMAMHTSLVDSHCHLDRLDLSTHDGDLSGALAAAADAGVGHLLNVCINLGHFPRVLEIAQAHAHIFATVGVHPNEPPEHEASLDELVGLAAESKVVAIGETGLDYFRSQGDLRWQRERFRRHIAAARQVGKPLVVHSREAGADTLRILRDEGAGEAGGVMHCFVDDWPTARQALDLGFYISLSGIVTFKNAGQVREVAAQVPLERLLVETDAPYLAPEPYRGKPNEPAWVRYVAARIAEVRGISLEALAAATTANFFRLFRPGGRATPPPAEPPSNPL